MKTMTFREIANAMAEVTHLFLVKQNEGEPLDGDQVQELSMMYEEELNKLNGNK